ncbi:MAG TPA: zinc ABC transporter substrate-binding protein [Candidatus Hydrogenedentes bacterium]|nr:zinc ABC transporter substrate-binding protein [Candidatus Hydrogenedentota bacterium]
MNSKQKESAGVRRHTVVLAIVALILSGCSAKPEPSPKTTDKIKVIAPFPPQAYFVEQVGGSRVEVTALVKTGSCAETYQITPKQMDALAHAHMYVRAGLPFEEILVSRIEEVCPQLKILDLQSASPTESKEVSTQHDLPPPHQEDPHTWLDPLSVIQQVHLIVQTLSTIDPAHQIEYSNHAAAFIREITALHEKISTLLAPLNGKTLYVFHPAFGHFAARYGLKQISLEREGKPPSQHHLEEVIEAMKRDGARTVFIEPQKTDPSLKAITETTGAQLVPLDPLNHEYLQNLEAMAISISKGLS